MPEPTDTSRPAPPPVRSPQRARLVLIAGAVMVVLAVLIVVLTSNRTDHASGQGNLNPDDFPDLVLNPLTEEERLQTGTDPEDISVRLAEGAFISGFSEDGKLVQRYTADGINPLPNREIEMTRPLAFLYMDDGRVVSLTGDVARVQRGGKNRIESGRISDNVVIRVYEPKDGVAPDPAVDQPAVTVRTNEAELNDSSGEIRCDGDVNVASDFALFTGIGLSILYDKVTGIERLTVEESEPIRIFASALRQREAAGGVVDEQPNVGETESSLTNDRSSGTAGSSAPRDRSRPADTPTEKSAVEKTPAPKPDRGRFYRLTMHDHVTIHRGPVGAQQQVTGDRLDIVFATNNKDLESTVSNRSNRLSMRDTNARMPRRLTGGLVNPTLGTMLAISAVGLTVQDIDAVSAPNESDEDIIVSFTGRLVMVPINDRADRLPSPDAVRLTLTGSPVQIHDEAQQVDAFGARVIYTNLDERLRLIGDESFPLRFASPDVSAEGSEFAFALDSNIGSFTGPGTMLMRDARVAAREFGPLQDPPAPDDAANGGLDIRWSRGVELEFIRDTQKDPNDPTKRGGRIRLATFRGDVVVRNVASDERFTMNTDELTVAFADQGAGEAESVRYIEATGNVVAQGLDGQNSTLLGDALRLDFEWNEELQHMSPRTLVVNGHASASDDTQSISADKLTVTLVELPPKSDATANDSNESKRRANIDIDTLLAERRVTVRLRDGLTVTGDRLFAVAKSEHAEMTGLPVRVVSNEASDAKFRMMGSQATIDRINPDAYRVRMEGGGQLKMNQPPAEDDVTVKADDAAPDAGPNDESDDGSIGVEDAIGETFVVEWEDSLQYDENAARKYVKIDIRGKVKAISKPTPLEESTIHGEKVVLELDLVDRPANEVEQPNDDKPRDVMSAMKKDRQLRSFTAHGAPAKLESRTWLLDDHSDAPKVHYIEGKQVGYKATTRNAEVVGNGTLLVQDLTPSKPGEPEPDFGERGTTMFEWSGGMTMKEVIDGRYEIMMDRDVTMRHRGMDGRIATLQAPHLDVTAKQRETTQSPGGLDFGGQVQLLRFVAKATDTDPLSRVHLEALGNTINASNIDYNYETALMQIRGTTRNPAMFSTEKQVTPTRASEILWDLRNGRIGFKDASTNNSR